ncbi:hypothetical protein FDK38_000745 [Candidozyma auris]|nr:hypothetical protein FDK38_000745 [[Candida] auris]
MLSGAFAGVRNIERLKKLATRSLSAQAATAPAESSSEFYSQEYTEELPRQSNTTTIAHALESKPANSFIGSLSSIHFASTYNPRRTTRDELKHEINRLLRTGQHRAVLKTFDAWTSSDSVEEFQNLLSHDEFSYIMGELVYYQKGLQNRRGVGALSSQDSIKSDSDSAESWEYQQTIRKIYSNLLFRGEGYIYSRSKRNSLGVTHYDLNVKDYENLIQLEVNNAKLDLASKWFQRFEQQYPDNSHYSRMTYKLWLLRFVVYAIASPSNWTVIPTAVNTVKKDPVRAAFKSRKHWLVLFNEFAQKQYLISGNTHFTFDKDAITTLIYSIANSREPHQIYSMVKELWGIDEKGRMVSGFKKHLPDDPRYPDIDILRALVISLVYNYQAVSSMIFVNAFQEHYGVDVIEGSKHFWNSLFKWAELTSRFCEDKALQYFLRKTKTKLVTPGQRGNFTIQEAQKSPDFDYEGFLTFINDLQTQRRRLMDELWKCYKMCNAGFSPRVFVSYFAVLKESTDDEKIYEYLTEVASQLHLHSLSKDSYNQSVSEGTMVVIRDIYEQALRSLIDMKGLAGDLDVISVIIRKWTLDGDMKNSLQKFVESREAAYERSMRMKNEKKEAEIQEDADEGLLGIMV